MATPNGRKTCLGKRRRDLGEHGLPEYNLTSDVWDALPECLVEEILAKLPLSSLMRFCRVCKRWRHLILSSKISPRCTSVPAHLFRFYKEKLTAFNSSRGTWEVVPLQFLQRQFTLLDVVASAGGLLCFSTAVLGVYIVWNPLTKYFKKLQMPCSAAGPISGHPCMPIPYTASDSLQDVPFIMTLLVGMVLDSDTGHFKLIVAGLLPCLGGRTLVYDSHADLWKKVGNVPEDARDDCPVKTHLPREACTVGGNYYVYFPHSFSTINKLFKYDVEQQEWSSILLPQFLGILQNVIERYGKLLLLTSDDDLDGSGLKTGTRFRVFELQERGPTSWLPTDCLPLSTYCEGLSNIKDIKDIMCLGQGDVFFFIGSLGRQTNSAYRNDSTAPFYSMKISVREWFHNSATNRHSEIISKWEEYRADSNMPYFEIFRPSMLCVK